MTLAKRASVVPGFDRERIEGCSGPGQPPVAGMGGAGPPRAEGAGMTTAFCKSWRRGIRAPARITSEDMFNWPNRVGAPPQAKEEQYTWTVVEVNKPICTLGKGD